MNVSEQEVITSRYFDGNICEAYSDLLDREAEYRANGGCKDCGGSTSCPPPRKRTIKKKTAVKKKKAHASDDEPRELRLSWSNLPIM